MRPGRWPLAEAERRGAGSEAPALHMPPAEAAALRAAYESAATILEYGAGGSTVMAAEMAGKTVFAVESDLAWIARLESWLAAHPPRAQVHLHRAEIGPTGDWGHPRHEGSFRRWPAYPLAVWDRPDFAHPDVVLIDGRFRVACLLSVLFRITRPVTVWFDDYRDRRPYHRVEDLLRPAAMVGRMARFDLRPTPVPPARLAWMLEFFTRSA